MGTIQNSVNQALWNTAGVAATSEHLKGQETANKLAQSQKNAEIASLEEKLSTTEEAYKNDTIEAAAAIRQNKDKEKLTDEEIASLEETDINKLAKNVETLREGKLTEKRIADMDKDKDNNPYRNLQPTVDAKGKKTYIDPLTNRKISEKTFNERNEITESNISRERKAAYNSFRELNERIAVTRELKFNIENAKARLAILKDDGKKGDR